MSANYDWLNLIERSGPFLTIPVLKVLFPDGVEGIDSHRAQRLRRAYEEWREAVDAEDPLLTRLHEAWIKEVLFTALEMDDDVLRRGDTLSSSLRVQLPEHGISLAPDLALVNITQGNVPLLLIHVFEPDTDLGNAQRFGGLVATPAERMLMLLRRVGCPVGLITDGERWMLVHAPTDGVASLATWYARLWAQEPETLRTFISLLSVRRFYGRDTETLPALFDRSLEHQDEVTEALGEQVRRAVEVLVQSLDRADQDRNRGLLRDVAEREMYEAALTVMMRLVFLLAAEERGLLLLDDARYSAYYAASSLRLQLRTENPEILEHRRSAWSRLLALFRAVYGGIEHPVLHLPAFGGSLFDPDRYPFLEGRAKGSSWRTDPAAPLPIDDRTVLLLLEAIQTFEGHVLSYRMLGIEQIGHVYEGLLERTVKRVQDVTLELDAISKAKDPRVTIGELESAALDGRVRLIELVIERCGRSDAAIRNALDRAPEERLASRLLTVCRGDLTLRDRILPYVSLLRTDPWGYPLVRPIGAFVVVQGTDRRETGTHYTPAALTEKIVEETLTPLVYDGPADNQPRGLWMLKSPAALLDLKICDPAMGSGAFLVQVCRFLGERLVEAWARVEAAGGAIDVDGYVQESSATRGFEPLPQKAEERILLARRLIAERCLYGVDLNPLAVELAKLSLWLVTLSKGRPFGFLDHNLKSGDSLLGIRALSQLNNLSINPSGQQQHRLFGRAIEGAMLKAIDRRLRMRELPLRDIRDVEAMAALNTEARTHLELPECIADAFIGVVFAGGSQRTLETRLASLAVGADQAAQGDEHRRTTLERQAANHLAKDAPDGHARRPFHWPIEFPEVFGRENGGFDAFVGNPPFLGGQRITGLFGTAYRDWLVNALAEGRRGSADLVAYFFLRAFSLLRKDGHFGLLAVKTIAEGGTRQVGLEAMLNAGAVIHAAYPNEPWPGSASVATSRVHVRKGVWQGPYSLLGRPASHISAFLSDREEWSPKRLKANEGISFQGSIVTGMGFVLTSDEANRMLDANPRNAEVIFPYLNGDDLNTDPRQRPSRYAINFWDWPEERARQYQLPYQWISERVKPERQRLNERGEFALRRPLPERWWQYEKMRPALYHAIGRGDCFERHPDDWNPNTEPMEKVLVCSEVTKHLAFAFVPNRYIMSANLDVFLRGAELMALCQSAIHEVWARMYSSKLETRLKYSPGNAFETFPFLASGVNQRLRQAGEQLEELRCSIMETHDIGLTKLYNRLHTPADSDPALCRLREMHREIDLSVARTYGWDDLDLDHGFREVPYLPENDRLRFTISESARFELLQRLSDLNRQFYEEELARGLHGGNTARSRMLRMPRPRRNVDTGAETQATFDFNALATPTRIGSVDSAALILDFLRAHPDWHAKSAVLSATGLGEGQWGAAIADLTGRNLVERLGERRGTRYRASDSGQ